MKNRKLKYRLLSLALCVGLTMSCFQTPVYAGEGKPVITMTEETDFPQEVTDDLAEETKTEVTEAGWEEVLEIQEEASLELMETQEESTTTLGSFENVKIVPNGFYLAVGGNFNNNGEDVSIYLVQYDDKNNKLLSSKLPSGYYWEIYSESDTSQVAPMVSDASYVRLEAVCGDVREWSQSFSCSDMKIPEVSFEAEISHLAATKAWLEIKARGDMQLEQTQRVQNIDFMLNLGTLQEKDSWSTFFSSKIRFDEGKNEYIMCDDLASDTTYYGELIVYVEAADDETEEKTVRVFEQRIPVDSFTTEKNMTYSMEKEFPDEVFRNAVRSQLSVDNWDNISDDEVTSEQLERVRYLSLSRWSFEEPVIKDITGIQLLKGIEDIYIVNHEVEDVTGIDWSELYNLKNCEFEGNELTKFPDLRENVQLLSVDVKRNKFSSEEMKKIVEKLPGNFSFDHSDYLKNEEKLQRVNGFSLSMGEYSYLYPTGNHIFVEPCGYKTSLPYTIKWYLDGKETVLKEYTHYNTRKIYYLLNSGLTEGNHTIKAELYEDETKVEETGEITFQVISQPVFGISDSKYITEDTRKHNAYKGELYFDESLGEPVSVELIDDKEKVYAKQEIESDNIYDSMGDPRFTEYDSVSWAESNISIQGTDCSMQYIYNTTPAGNYHLKVHFADGSYQIARNVLVSLPRKEPLILDCYPYNQYDNTGDYVYVAISGRNLEPEKYTYDLGYHYPVSYVSHRNTKEGAVVQLKKEGWNFEGEKYWNIAMTVDGGTEKTYCESMTMYSELTRIYYMEYNKILDQVEMAVTSDLKGKRGKVSLMTSYDMEDSSIVAETEVVLQDDMMLLDFQTLDGTDYLIENGTYYVALDVDSKRYVTRLYVYGVSRTEVSGMEADTENHPEDPGITALPATEEDEETWNGEESSKITEKSEIIHVAENLPKDNSKEYLDMGSQSQDGKEEVIEDLYESEMETEALGKFTIKNLQASWNGSSEISVYVSSASAKKDDKYTLTLVDENGIQPKGITTTYSIYEGSSISFRIKGLNIKDAAKQYYIKITHNTLGEPYDSAGEKPFYLDSRGVCVSITQYDISYSTRDERMVGIFLKESLLPTKLQIFKTNAMELLHEVNITSSDVQGDAYYFTQELIDKLPVKDRFYHLVLSYGDQRVYESNYVISCQEELQASWKYTIDKSVLYTNDEAGKTAVIEVTGNKKKPTFKSSNTNAITVKVDDSNPAKAILTAVGLGESQITISADGFSRRFMLRSERKVALEKMTLNSTSMVLGVKESGKLCANVFPAEAWKEDMEITFHTENNDIISIENGADGEAVIFGLQPGTAVVTVAMTGTELTAECTVTVENKFDDTEYDALLAEAGKNCVLVNAYPKNEVFLKDVILPEGWSWVDGNVKLSADDMLPIQYYTARLRREGYQTMTAVLPVAVSELLSVEISGKTLLSAEGSQLYQVEGKYQGYQPKNEELGTSLQYQWTTETEKEGFTILEQGENCLLTAKKVSADTVQKLTLTAIMGENRLSTDINVKVASKPFVEQITFSIPESQPEKAVKKYEYSISANHLPQIVIDSKEVGKNTNELKVVAQGFAGENQVNPEKGFQWTSSDPSVVTVKTEGENSAILTFKKTGSAVIQVTTQEEGAGEQEFIISVMDYDAILEKKLSFDIYAENGTRIPMKVQNCDDFVSMIIQEQDGGTKEWRESSKVEAVKEGEEFYLKAKSGYAPEKNENIKAQIVLKKVNGMEVCKAVTIAVNAKTKPKASFKVAEKAHLLYKDATAVYQIVSKYDIASVEEVKDGTGFELAETNVSENVFVFKAKDLSAETLKDYKAKNSPLCQVTLKVKFKGYTEAADQLITLKIATNTKIPTLKVKDVTIFYGQSLNKTQIAYVSPIQPDGKEEIVSKTDGVGLRMGENAEVEVQYLLYKNKSYKAELISENWTQAVPLKGKIKVSNPGSQKMILDTAKITLNTAYNIQDHGKMKIGVSLKDNDTQIEQLSYQIDKKNSTLFNDGYLSITYSKNQQKVYVGLNKGLQGQVKPGTYKVNLIGKVRVNGQEYQLKASTLKIQLTDKAPSITLKAKGSIDLTKRNSSVITYTPVYRNMMAVTESVKLSGIYAPYFTAKVEQGIVYVSAKENYPMSDKITYPLTIHLGLDNGEVKAMEVNIKPVSKMPKVKAQITKATLYKSGREEISYQVVGNDRMTSVDRIERIKDEHSFYFDFETEGNQIKVSLSEEAARMKPGKYTLSYKVYPKGAAYDGKSIVLKLAITVK